MVIRDACASGVTPADQAPTMGDWRMATAGGPTDRPGYAVNRGSGNGGGQPYLPARRQESQMKRY
jgi:hypothetical protein